MAFAFGFPDDVTALIYSMRDWRLEEVKAEGGTPSARCFQTPMPEYEDLGFDGLFDDHKSHPLPAIVPVLPCVEAEYGLSVGDGGTTVPKDGWWIHARRKTWRHRIEIYHWDHRLVGGEPFVIRLPNQNLKQLQDRLDARARELWQHKARSLA